MNHPTRISLIALLLSACAGSPSSGLDPGNTPSITRFTASPAALTAPGPITLAWEVSGATSLEIDGGVGSVTPATTGSKPVNLDATVTYTLTARNAAGSATARVTARLAARPFAFEIDPTIHPKPDQTSDGRGGTLPLAASRDEQGVRSEFIANQVLIVPKTQAELDGFLTRTGGTVIDDDTVPVPPAELGITLTDAQRKATTYTVRLDPSAFSLATFGADAATAGLEGKVVLSSETAARLMALSIREVAAGRAVGLNYLSRPDAVMLRTEEQPSGAGFADAFATPRFQASGSRSNVVGAWQWLRAKGTVRRVRVAILDGGFWMDGNGQPNSVAGIGSDLPANPIQRDFVNDDTRVGDPNPGVCTGGTPCPWHGNSAASVATGFVNNRAAAAGTGGMVAAPMLFHLRTTKDQQKAALRTARAWGADVINMSFSGACNYWCRQEEGILGYDEEIKRARNAGIVLVASAGNSTENVDSEYVHPCNYDGVICVGALNDDTNTPQGYSGYGGSVDLWAPTNLPVMPHGANPTVHSYGGTSAAAPFVAGIAAMMKAVNPGLTGDQVRHLLRDTAWTDSPDPKVSHSVNAFEAVKRASNNDLPADRFEANDAPASATVLTPAQHDDLTIHAGSDVDRYRFSTTGPSLATLDLTYADGVGKPGFANYGLNKDAGCGDPVQESYATTPNRKQITYRLPSGDFSFALAGGKPMPYDLGLTLSAAPLVPDSYEPNDMLALKSLLGDGKSVRANLHTATDVDHYSFYSRGNFKTMVLSLTSEARVEGADGPLTLRVYNAAGVPISPAVISSDDCAVPARLVLPEGFVTVAVSGAAPGAYTLWLGSQAEQHPVLSVKQLIYLILHPNVPVELTLRDPVEYFAINKVSDLGLSGVELLGAGLHLTLYSETGTLIAEGEALRDGAGERIKLAQALPEQHHVLRVAQVLEGEEGTDGRTPIPVKATLNIQTGR